MYDIINISFVLILFQLLFQFELKEKKLILFLTCSNNVDMVL